jgi:hypothetical protein
MKKYYLIYFSNQWNRQHPTYQNDVIDTTPMEWLLKWHSSESNASDVIPMTYEQNLISAMEITEQEYNDFIYKFKS